MLWLVRAHVRETAFAIQSAVESAAGSKLLEQGKFSSQSASDAAGKSRSSVGLESQAAVLARAGQNSNAPSFQTSATTNTTHSRDHVALEAVLACGVQDAGTSPLINLYSSVAHDSAITIASLCGTMLAGDELRRLKDSFRGSVYPECPTQDLMYPSGAVEDIQMQVLRRNNIYMPCKRNQRVYGTIYAVNKDRVWVDVGHTSLAIFKRSELLVSHMVPSAHPSEEARSHAHDVKVGDRFLFRIQEPRCPLGGVWLEPEQYGPQAVQEAVWDEIKHHHITGEPVGGRILNDCDGGLAVGIAGIVGLLRSEDARASGDPSLVKKLGVLQPFVVSYINSKSKEFFVRFPHGAQGRLARLRKRERIP